MCADIKREPQLSRALADIAPGTGVRAGIEDIMRGRTGALIVMGDEDDVAPVCSGGVRIDAPFSPKLLYELAKMDGAIVLDRDASVIRQANVHLVPDSALETNETGTRHRSAERTARHTRALVVTVSASRDVVTLFVGDTKYQLEPTRSLQFRVNQALATLETYRTRLDQVSHRLLSRELGGNATLLDALVVIQRAEMATRIVAEIDRHRVELGSEGRIIELQLRELSVGIAPDRAAVVRDYVRFDDETAWRRVIDRIGRIGNDRLLRLEDLELLIGYEREVNPIDTLVEPRGFRVLSRIPGLSNTLIDRIVEHFGSLSAILEADVSDLTEVSGLGKIKSFEVHDSLRRMREFFLRPGAGA